MWTARIELADRFLDAEAALRYGQSYLQPGFQVVQLD